MTNHQHIPRRSGSGPRHVLLPFFRRFDEAGRATGKVRLRPAPHRLSMAAAARRLAVTEALT